MSKEMVHRDPLKEASLQRKKIQKRLIQWYEKNKRDLPWRRTHDPFAIWVSEIMLQQTQVDTVIPYYQRFLKAFPTVRNLAKADLSRVLKAWEGLGYYSRARNLHKASRIVLKDFGGRIPDHPEDLLCLPGIGKYTAGAILSIAHNKDAPVLDGNVKRVLSRLFAISGDPASGKTGSLLWSLSESLVPKGHASDFNQALMDLGATVCIPKAPQCPRCPLKTFCMGRLSGNPEQYPSPKAKKKIPHIEGVSAVIVNDGKVLLNRRASKGLLGGLWEFPNWKVEGRELDQRGKLRNRIKKKMGIKVEVKESIGTFKQTFSHFRLTLHVYRCEAIDSVNRGRWTLVRALDRLPMSRIHRKIALQLRNRDCGLRV
jgi:A/G-specific adenine glycosylase